MFLGLVIRKQRIVGPFVWKHEPVFPELEGKPGNLDCAVSEL